MAEKHVCAVAHPQIVSGNCPWCDQPVLAGEVHELSAGVSDADTTWNWQVMADNLRGGDRSVRANTLSNLSDLTNELVHVLPLFSIALQDEDHEHSKLAEMSCRQLSRDLSETQTAWLEGQVSSRDNELAARLMLLGKYFLGKAEETRQRRAEHIYWMIEHHPACHTAGTPDALLLLRREPALYRPAKEIWLRKYKENDQNPAIVGNAARFFTVNEPQLSEKLFLQAQTLEPEEPEWHVLLAQLYSLTSRRELPLVSSAKARQALVELEMAEQLRSAHAGVPTDEESKITQLLTRLHSLPSRAKAALAAGEIALAKSCAQELLSLTSSEQFDEDFRNDRDAIHQGHLVLGQIALRDGDLENAKHHLLESGKSTGSPVLGSFGPNMSLAKELLEREEREVVLEYLELCQKFWHGHGAQLDEWQTLIRAGQVPNFGGNLVY